MVNGFGVRWPGSALARSACQATAALSALAPKKSDFAPRGLRRNVGQSAARPARPAHSKKKPPKRGHHLPFTIHHLPAIGGRHYRSLRSCTCGSELRGAQENAQVAATKRSPASLHQSPGYTCMIATVRPANGILRWVPGNEASH